MSSGHIAGVRLVALFEKRQTNMFRPLLVIVALLPVIGAQTPSTEPVPMSVIGYVTWPITSGPELSMTVQNSSARGIQGYLYEVIFTDPETGKQVSKSESIGCYRWPGVELAAGSETHVVKPVPITARGIPANYSFNIDLVFLD